MGNQPRFQLACDGKLVLQRLRRIHTTDPNEPHANLLSATRYQIQHSGVTTDLHHVKGHQDSKCFGPFTRDATLNIKADLLAREKLEKYRPGPIMFHIPWSQGVCYAGTQRIEKAFPKEI